MAAMWSAMWSALTPWRMAPWRRAGLGSDLESKMTPAGLEPAIPGSVGQCLIHWATGPDA